MRKKGVLIINGCLPPPYGGIAKYLSYSLPILAKKGYKIWACMPRNYSKESYHEYIEKGISVVMPVKKNTYFRAVFLLSTYFKYVWERCVRYRLSLIETLSILHTWLPELDNVVKNNKDDIDIIHVYDAPWAQGWIGYILSKKYNKQFLLTTFGEVVPHKDEIELIDDTSYKYRDFCKFIVDKADVLASCTRYCISNLMFLRERVNDVYLTYPVSDMDNFIAAVASSNAERLFIKYPKLRSKRIILFVGQIQKRKGPHILVQAARKVLEQFSDVLFVFVGPDCGLRDDLLKMIDNIGLADKILFIGPVSDDDLYSFYSSAELFIFPTISKIECLGLTFVQAMFAKRPVIAANISGVPEVIEHGTSGLLFKPGDIEELGNAILILLNDKLYADKLALNGHLKVNQMFSKELVINQIINFYKVATAS